MPEFSLKSLADHLGAELDGDPNLIVTGIAPLDEANKQQISFLANKKYRKQLAETAAAAVILSPDESSFYSGNKIITSNPYLAYALLAQYIDSTPVCANGIADSAVIHPSAKIHPDANIGANVVVEAEAVIEAGAQIGPGSFIGVGAQIGAQTKLWANVSIYHHVVIGEKCLFQSGAVIGSDGFGYANDKGCWIKIPQLGRVVIGDRVEIGASTTVDRGALGDTEIDSDVIIDNQCQIAHNVKIGQGTAIAGCTVIAGSTRIGRFCQIAGACCINGHIEVADRVIFTGMTMVTKSVTEPGLYSSGFPHLANKEWRKNATQLPKLSELNKRVKQLENQLASLASPAVKD